VLLIILSELRGQFAVTACISWSLISPSTWSHEDSSACGSFKYSGIAICAGSGHVCAFPQGRRSYVLRFSSLLNSWFGRPPKQSVDQSPRSKTRAASSYFWERSIKTRAEHTAWLQRTDYSLRKQTEEWDFKFSWQSTRMTVLDVVPCRLENFFRRLRGAYCLCHQVDHFPHMDTSILCSLIQKY
jgi:hypothetical protein